MSRAFATPIFVIEARCHKENRMLFLNFCSCDEIPLPQQSKLNLNRKPGVKLESINQTAIVSSEAVSELFYLVACERKRTKNKYKNNPEEISLQHTRAVDVFLHSLTLADDKIDAVILDCKKIHNNVCSVPNLCMDFVVVCF
jgi:hypothetical protein